jgi:photosystem II stability/assembly factor-like uncharacterized protein
MNVQTQTIGQHSIALSGNGSDSRWITVHDAESLGKSTTLNDIAMLDPERGWIAGDGGTFLETRNGGRSWIPHVITTADLNDIATQPPVTNELFAEYHFEEIPGTLTFLDRSGNMRHATSPSASQTPILAFANGRAGSGIRFDGIDDFIELPGIEPAEDFAISMWVNLDDISTGQILVSKYLDNSNQFFLGIFGGGYRILWLSNFVTVGSATTGWHHIVLNVNYKPNTNETSMQLFRDNVSLTFQTFPGKLPSGGKPFSIGQEWDSQTTPSDFLGGAIDEVYFFEGNLGSNQRAVLGGSGGPRMAVVGDRGSVFASGNQGATWRQESDQRVRGWRADDGPAFRNYQWNSAGFAADGRLMVAGEQDTNQRVLMLEDLDEGQIGLPNDSAYDDVTFAAAAGTGAGEHLESVILSINQVFAFGSRGVGYFASTPDTTWNLHGGLDVGQLNAAAPFSIADYVAVGDGGTIIRSKNAPPVLITHDLTTANLHGIKYEADIFDHEMQVVGDSGIYLTSNNDGVDWTQRADGLSGNNRAIDVVGVGANYEAWVVGEESRIQYRPESEPSGPFLAFAPGELDFGFRLVGESKSLPVKIYNRGKSDLALGSLTIEGSGYSIVQGAVQAIAPGDAVEILVRYKPTAISPLDVGSLNLATNDNGQIFQIPLVGRASSLLWDPVSLNQEGDVIDMEFITDKDNANVRRGFAILETPTGSRLKRTTNDGVSWFSGSLIVNPALAAGQKLKLESMSWVADAAAGNTLDVGVACGSVVDSAGNFVRGIVLRSEGGDLWFDRTPSQSTDKPFGAIDLFDRLHPNVMVAVSAGGSGDVWQTENGGISWEKEQSAPGNFDGSAVVIVPNNNVAPADRVRFSQLLAAGNNFIYSKQWQNNWFHTGGIANPSQVFNTDQAVRDFAFFDIPTENNLIDLGWIVGESGLFWRIDPHLPGPDAFHSAANAEVFGTTDLSGVSFHDPANGWVVGESQIFVSDDSGKSWALNHDAGELAQINKVDSAGANLAWAGGSVGGQATVWRYRGFTAAARGTLAVNDVELFDPVEKDGVTTRTITLDNIGNAPLDIHNASLVSDDPLSRFRIATSPLPDSIPAGGSATIDVEFVGVPETALVEQLKPELMLRFEQGLEDTTYFDESGHMLHATAAPDPAQQPQIVDGELGRDRCLHFDGNDYAELDGYDTLGEEYSFSIWVNIEKPTSRGTFFGKHSSTGGTNRILLGRQPNPAGNISPSPAESSVAKPSRTSTSTANCSGNTLIPPSPATSRACPGSSVPRGIRATGSTTSSPAASMTLRSSIAS